MVRTHLLAQREDSNLGFIALLVVETNLMIRRSGEHGIGKRNFSFGIQHLNAALVDEDA